MRNDTFQRIKVWRNRVYPLGLLPTIKSYPLHEIPNENQPYEMWISGCNLNIWLNSDLFVNIFLIILMLPEEILLVWQLTNHSWTKHSKPSRATGVKVSLLGVQHFVKLKFNSSYVVSTDWHCLYLGTHALTQYTALINNFDLSWFLFMQFKNKIWEI